jgi:glyoxylase-like metal-dependent hydrolase (beta-lactamase superfamily II)
MQELDDTDSGLWTFHQRLSVMGVEIGTRMTVVRLSDGGLLVHSPIRLTPELEQKLASLGRVEHVLAPNLDHYLFVAAFRERYPHARFYATPGVAPKLPEVRFDAELRFGQTAPLGDGIEQAWFRSNHELQELVLLHRSTRTLITADLAFNMQSSDGLISKLMLKLNDSYLTFGPSRVCRAHITEPVMARSDVDAILALKPERAIVAHGEILGAGATAAIERAYSWLRS